MTFPTRVMLKKAVCALCVTLGVAIPASLRSFYILRVYRKAGRAYRLRPLSGEVTLFVQQAENAASCWDGLASESVEVRRNTSRQSHRRSPGTARADWAEKLKTSLVRARCRAQRKALLDQPQDVVAPSRLARLTFDSQRLETAAR